MTIALSQEASLYLPDIGTQNWGALFNANLEQLDGGFILKLVAGETIEAWDAVYIKNDGKMYKAKADSLTTLPSIGIAIANVTSSAEGKVKIVGWIDYDDSSKTALAADEGDPIYVSATVGGELAATAPTNAQLMGIAKTPTTANITRIIINPVVISNADIIMNKIRATTSGVIARTAISGSNVIVGDRTVSQGELVLSGYWDGADAGTHRGGSIEIESDGDGVIAGYIFGNRTGYIVISDAVQGAKADAGTIWFDPSTGDAHFDGNIDIDGTLQASGLIITETSIGTLHVTSAFDCTNATLGDSSVNEITCVARLKPRDLGADPTAGGGIAGTRGEVAYYNDKAYLKTVDTGTNTNWSALN